MHLGMRIQAYKETISNSNILKTELNRQLNVRGNTHTKKVRRRNRKLRTFLGNAPFIK